MIKIKNAYELPELNDGYRVLAERLWPKAMKENSKAIDEWIKELSPSAVLESWYGFDPDLWEGFRRKYITELKHNKNVPPFMQKFKGHFTITLLFTTSHKTNNPALVLKQFLDERFENDIK